MLAYFDEDNKGWRASNRLHRMIRFERRNLLTAPRANQQFDLILCRNLLLYLDVPARRAACRNLETALAPHGRLLLGGGETVLDHSDKFAPVPGGGGLYGLASSMRATLERLSA